MSLDTIIATMLARTPPGSASNYGGMCERMANMSVVGYPCWKCDGMGFVEIEPEELAQWRLQIAQAKRPEDVDEQRRKLSRACECKACAGTGFIEGRLQRVTADSMYTTIRCGKCRGCGETFPPSDATAEFEDVCPRCAGASYLVPITVRSTGSSKSGRQPRHAVDSDANSSDSGGGGEVSEWVDESSLLEFGRASSVLEDLRKADPAAVAAIEAYGGPAGDKWGKHRWGRLFALWPLTRPGKHLLALGLDRSNPDVRHLLDPLQVLATEREQSEREHDSWENADRRRFVGQADRAARELWAHAQGVMRRASL